MQGKKMESKVICCFSDACTEFQEFSMTGMINEVSPLQLLAESASVLYYNRMIEEKKK